MNKINNEVKDEMIKAVLYALYTAVKDECREDAEKLIMKTVEYLDFFNKNIDNQ